MRSSPVPTRSRMRGARTPTGPMPVMILCGFERSQNSLDHAIGLVRTSLFQNRIIRRLHLTNSSVSTLSLRTILGSPSWIKAAT
jgi:hypothetical protein